MKRNKKVAVGVIIIAVGLFAFFFIPAFYWFSVGPGYATPHPVYQPFYRSLGCMTVGLGDEYSAYLAQAYFPNWYGLQLGCGIPPLPR
jgi:hypothetical protein